MIPHETFCTRVLCTDKRPTALYNQLNDLSIYNNYKLTKIYEKALLLSLYFQTCYDWSHQKGVAPNPYYQVG